jgi:L-aspartate oxidase
MEAIEQLTPLAGCDGATSDPAMVALVIAVFAHQRCESRGAHARTDFPAPAALPSRQRMTLADVLNLANTNRSNILARSA